MEQLITTSAQIVAGILVLALVGLAAVVVGPDSRSPIGDDHRR